MNYSYNLKRFSFLEDGRHFTEKEPISNSICYEFQKFDDEGEFEVNAAIYIPFNEEHELVWFYQGDGKNVGDIISTDSYHKGKNILPDWMFELVDKSEKELHARDKIRKIFKS